MNHLRRRAVWVACAALVAAAATAAVHASSPVRGYAAADYVWKLPPGFPVPSVPSNNAMSPAKVELGRRLFFDPRLSITGQYSCASCHDPARAFSDGRARAIGATGARLRRNAPSLVNVAYASSLGWEQRNLRSLERQMLIPLFNDKPIELGLQGRERTIELLLARDAELGAAFAAAFPYSDNSSQPVSIANAVRAIAAFERTVIYGDSPFDHYVFRGEHSALSDAAKRGMAWFFSARSGCSNCHSGLNLAGPWVDASTPRARAAFASNDGSGREFRIPTLRNVAVTAPYMHDGRYGTLDVVVDHYLRAGHRKNRDPRIRLLTMSLQQRADLLAFLNSLTDSRFAVQIKTAKLASD